ncbi:hypothetical protein ACIBW9_37075 [Streptomyces sp. NPDC049541]|uniref:hypothetical protein n=1 Tax=Streptomyces sp. NPDC049541 TaxID=3365594 RepID=UPI0037A84E93
MRGGDGLFETEPVEVQRTPGPAAAVDKTFRTLDLHHVLLLPPSLDNWLPKGHLAQFTSDSGFRDEVEAEEALARGQFLAEMGADSDRPALAGPAGDEAEARIAEFARHTVFDGQVVTDEARLRRIVARHDPHMYPGTFVTCVYNPDRALCRTSKLSAGLRGAGTVSPVGRLSMGEWGCRMDRRDRGPQAASWKG